MNAWLILFWIVVPLGALISAMLIASAAFAGHYVGSGKYPKGKQVVHFNANGKRVTTYKAKEVMGSIQHVDSKTAGDYRTIFRRRFLKDEPVDVHRDDIVDIENITFIGNNGFNAALKRRDKHYETIIQYWQNAYSKLISDYSRAQGTEDESITRHVKIYKQLQSVTAMGPMAKKPSTQRSTP